MFRNILRNAEVTETVLSVSRLGYGDANKETKHQGHFQSSISVTVLTPLRLAQAQCHDCLHATQVMSHEDLSDVLHGHLSLFTFVLLLCLFEHLVE